MELHTLRNWATRALGIGTPVCAALTLACSAMMPDAPERKFTTKNDNRHDAGLLEAEGPTKPSSVVAFEAGTVTTVGEAGLSGGVGWSSAGPTSEPAAIGVDGGVQTRWGDAAAGCDESKCNEPPPPRCEDEQTLTIYADVGACGEVGCVYEADEIDCEWGCAEGRCADDPCWGVTCEDSPESYCESATEFVAYDAQGTCVDGECVYQPRSIGCECSGSSCLEDPCIDVTCDTPPGARCNDDGTLTNFSADGTCQEGSCTYEESRTSCAACRSGQCQCPAGSFVDEADGKCKLCPDGEYSSEENSEACRTHTICTPGMFVSSPGDSVSDRQCAACDLGAFSATSNASACSDWSNCAPGQYVAIAGSETRDQKCSACPSDAYSSEFNAPQCTGYTTCAAGTYVSRQGGPTSDRECAACADGYSTIPNATNCTPFTACAAGEYVSKPGSASSNRQCSTCVNGYSTTANATACTAYSTCSKGQYVLLEGTVSSNRRCAACPDGQYSLTSNSAECTPYTVCGANEVETKAGTKESDRTCACASGFTECNGQCVATSSVTYYRDVDADSFGDSETTVVSCNGAPSGYVSTNTDCCDSDGDARPNQTTFFSDPTQCGGYDYNCNGTESLRYTSTAACGGGGGGCGCSEGWFGGGVRGCGGSGQYVPEGGANTCSSFPSRPQECL